MWTYLLKRVLLMIPTLFGISMIVFVIMVAAPGRPGEKAQAMGEVNATSDPTKEKSKGESARVFREKYRLNRPVFWNGWTSLGRDDVLAAVRTSAAAQRDVGIDAKRRAKEQLEDWGDYAVPALVELLGDRALLPGEQDNAWPPIMTLAIEARAAAPGPRPNAMGIMPAMRVSVVIRIGRKRVLFASMIAVSRGTPLRRSVVV